MSNLYRILVIDDDPFIREIIMHTLTHKGYKVKEAKNGKEALDFAKNDIFHLIISDLHMPIMNGLDFCAKLKSFEEYKLTPFLFLSSDKKKNFKIKGLATGADDFISKPFDSKMLMAKVESLIKKYTIQKDKFSKDKLNHLNFDLGCILICASDINAAAKTITANFTSTLVSKNLKSFTNELGNNNIWIILILETAEWALKSISKINELAVEKNVKLCALMSVEDESRIMEIRHSGEIDVIPSYKSPTLVVNEIDIRLKRELDLKKKYIGALNRAANNSPLRFEREKEFKIGNLNFFMFHQPFQQIPGGDYYEVFDLEDGSSLIVIGDVMGKKWGAWFFVMGYIAYLRSSIRFFLNVKSEVLHEPDRLLSFLNEQVYKDIQLSEVFTTLTILYFCKEDSSLKLASAGGLAPLIYRDKPKRVDELKLEGRILGLDIQTIFESNEVILEEGDSILLYTDGYSESFDSEGKMIGKERVSQFLKEFSEKKTEGFPNDLDDCFENKFRIKIYNDDRTALFISNEG